MADASHNMQRPEVASTPLPRLSATERDARNLILASTARGWEGDVNDIADMARVFLTVLEGTLGSSKDPDHEDTYLITHDQISQIYFCAYHGLRMAESFHDRFYAALSA